MHHGRAKIVFICCLSAETFRMSCFTNVSYTEECSEWTWLGLLMSLSVNCVFLWDFFLWKAQCYLHVNRRALLVSDTLWRFKVVPPAAKFKAFTCHWSHCKETGRPGLMPNHRQVWGTAAEQALKALWWQTHRRPSPETAGSLVR